MKFWWILVCGCEGAGIDLAGGDPVVDPPVDTFARATDSTIASPTPHGDSQSDDTAPASPQVIPPTWSGGLVERSPWLTAEPLVVFAGDAAAGVAPDDAVALPADLDGDGVKELIVGNLALYASSRRAVRVYRWSGGDWARAPDLDAAVSGQRRGVPYGAIDLDGDGADELIFADQGTTVVWGPVTEGDRPASQPFEGRAETGAQVVDLDLDGWLDLIAPERGCAQTMVPWMRTGPRRFVARPEWVPAGPHVLADAIFAWPQGDRRTRLVVIGTSCGVPAHTGVVLATPGPAGVALTEEQAFPADAYWRLTPEFVGKSFTEVAPMGAGVADLDRDGAFDLVVTTGLAEIGVFTTDASGAWVDRTWLAGVATNPLPRPPGAPPLAAFAWSVGFPDLDLDGRADLIVTTGDDGTSYHVAAGVHMVNEVWWNAPDWPMREATTEVGLGMPGGWRGLMLHDQDADGDADVSLGGYGVPPRWLRNDLDVGHHGMAVRLHGTTSNPLGIGAVIEVATPDGVQRHLHAPPGNLQGLVEPTTWVGLGDAIEGEVTVIWPTGRVHRVGLLPAGAEHVIAEPPVVTIPDRDRRAPAGAALRVEVTPRDASGDPQDAVVEVRAEGAVVTAADGGWEVRRDAPGEAEVVVRIDGVEVLVHPRLWWD